MSSQFLDGESDCTHVSEHYPAICFVDTPKNFMAFQGGPQGWAVSSIKRRGIAHRFGGNLGFWCTPVKVWFEMSYLVRRAVLDLFVFMSVIQEHCPIPIYLRGLGCMV